MCIHQTPSKAKFPDTDAITITRRMNEGIDDVSCVVGKEGAQCFLEALIPRKK